MPNKKKPKGEPILILTVPLQLVLPLDGLGKITTLARLSKKRVTAKVRETLRQIFNKKNVSVSCEAWCKKGTWIGFWWFVTNSKR